MTTEVQTQAKPNMLSAAIVEQLVMGDLSKLTPAQRVQYYAEVCRRLGLNPLTKPFAYIVLNGQLTLYAKRDAADQLRKINKISLEVVGTEILNDILMVRVKAFDGVRYDEDMGAVSVRGLSGDSLANAYMKAITKAKRRTTLSICGLGLLDESEVETIKDAKILDPGNDEAAPVVDKKAPATSTKAKTSTQVRPAQQATENAPAASEKATRPINPNYKAIMEACRPTGWSLSNIQSAYKDAVGRPLTESNVSEFDVATFKAFLESMGAAGPSETESRAAEVIESKTE